MKGRFGHLILLGAVVAVAGCGGGGGGGTTSRGGGGSPGTYGPISTMSVGAVKTPVVMGSRNAVFTAVFGAAFTSIRAQLPPASSLPLQEALAQTSIAVNKQGHAMLYDYGTGQLNPIGNEGFFGDTSTPKISPLGDKVALTHYVDGSGNLLFTEALDGTTRKQITNGPNYVYDPSFSKDGKSIVFTGYSFGIDFKYVLYSLPAIGGTPTQLTSKLDASVKPFWRDDGKVAYFRQVNSSGNFLPWLMNADGTGSTQLSKLSGSEVIGPASISFFPGAAAHDGMLTRYAGGNYYLERFNDTGTWQILGSPNYIAEVSCSPLGNYCVYRSPNGIYVMDVTDGSQVQILSGGSSYVEPSWGPYVTNRNLVGTGGSLGASAGGFLFGQIGDAIKSFIAVDATTRTTISVEPQANPNPSQANAVCTLTADNVTLLKFANGFGGSSVTVATAQSPISGAVISFNADTGRVSSVVPFKGTVPARVDHGLKYKGRFTGVWDAHGKNLAPDGANEVTLNPYTGELSSVR